MAGVMTKLVIVGLPSLLHCIADSNIIFSHSDHGRLQRTRQNQHPSEPHIEHVPDLHVVHVPDFKDPALSLALSSGDLAPCKTMFLNSNWITPDLRRHVESLVLPALGVIKNGAGVRDEGAFQEACSVIFKEG
jgi:hypothetical protein